MTVIKNDTQPNTKEQGASVDKPIQTNELIDMSLVVTTRDQSSGVKKKETTSNGTSSCVPEESFNNIEDTEYRLTSCGIGSWRPKWLQRFSNPIFFLINLSLLGVTQGMTWSIYYSTMNTLEKRYGFDSKISALIIVADNLQNVIIGPIVGYYAPRFNRAQLIGLCQMILSCSCIATALPYFIYGPATHLLTKDESSLISSFLSQHVSTTTNSSSSITSNFEMCDNDSLNNQCGLDDSVQGTTVWPAVAILFATCFIRGLGFTGFYVVAMPYLDDNVSKRNSPIYLSLSSAVFLIGPAIGYFTSAFFLQFYEDPWNDPGLSRNDPRFIGAWWLSFIVVGVFMFIVSLPTFLFPVEFKNASVKTSTIRQQMKSNGGTWDAVKRIVRKPLIILYFLGNQFRYIGMTGYYQFIVKYIENQYRQSSSKASFITGSASILPISVGILLGGIFISFYRPKARLLFTFIFIAEFVSLFTIGSGIFLGCDPIQLQGTTGQEDGLFSLQTNCNNKCTCSEHIYTPICGPDGRSTFFSPCHAGCNEYDSVNATFANCTCFTGHATKGYCEADLNNCGHNLKLYLAMVITGALISATARTGNSLITFRTVEPMDKSFTIGLLTALASIFAFTPGPFIFGGLIDSSCLVWEGKCGKKGNCWIYDQADFRNKLHITACFFLGIGSLFDFIMIFFSNHMKNLYDDDEDNNDNDKNVDKTKSTTTEIVENIGDNRQDTTVDDCTRL